MSAPYDIVAVQHLGAHRLRLTFADGVVSEVDFTAKLEAAVGPVFEPLKDPDFFAQVRVDPEVGTIVWPNGADLSPDVLYELAVAAA
jgi:hypothetical protein